SPITPGLWRVRHREHARQEERIDSQMLLLSSAHAQMSPEAGASGQVLVPCLPSAGRFARSLGRFAVCWMKEQGLANGRLHCLRQERLRDQIGRLDAFACKQPLRIRRDEDDRYVETAQN